MSRSILKRLNPFSFKKKEADLVPKGGKLLVCREIQESSGGSYIVRSVEELMWVAMMVNEQKFSFAGETIVLAADLNLKGYDWIPIGCSRTTPFQGIFDGGGKYITGLRVRGDGDCVGFFGAVAGVQKLWRAEVRNMRLSEIRIQGMGEHTYAGGLIGCAQDGVLVEKCVVGGVVESHYGAGGLIGRAEDGVAIRSSSVRGQIVGEVLSGSLVGSLMEHSTLFNCRSVVTDHGGQHLGVLVGEMDENSLIRECVGGLMVDG